MRTFLLGAVIWLCGWAGMAQTNFFYTDDGLGKTSDKVEASRRSHESLPANLFRVGNWGPIVEGFQLSLRFSKQSYTNGEPVHGAILLRNVSGSNLVFQIVFALDRDFRLTVFDPEHRQLPDRADLSVGAVRTAYIWADTQHKFDLRLDKRFDLTELGTYTIVAKRRVPKAGLLGMSEVVSGIVRIQITRSPVSTNEPPHE